MVTWVQTDRKRIRNYNFDPTTYFKLFPKFEKNIFQPNELRATEAITKDIFHMNNNNILALIKLIDF